MPNEKPGSQRAIQLGTWAPGDYINEHRFCPLEDIQRALDQYRAQAGASELAVVALDANVCLRTLSFVAHNGTAGGRALNAALTERPFRLRDILGNNPLWRNL